MYDVVSQTPKEVVFLYIMFMSACFVTYPIVRLIVTAAEKGLDKWR
ncbi:hypothetical protein [Peribacillus sp. TH24]|nr:hypothetical protein [Peribacillus sp. TH24]MBK5447036.1 hypothetical protein [Peribacillus sp. TH24]MBK5447067.1 hypothetical protein [Peribacillus sp. TH24]